MDRSLLIIKFPNFNWTHTSSVYALRALEAFSLWKWSFIYWDLSAMFAHNRTKWADETQTIICLLGGGFFGVIDYCSWVCPYILSLAEINLIFFIPVHTVLCYVFVTETVMVTYQYFGCYWTVLARLSFLPNLPLY